MTKCEDMGCRVSYGRVFILVVQELGLSCYNYLTKISFLDQIYSCFPFHKKGVLIMTLTKADLIDQVYATNSEMTKAQSREAVETILSIIKSKIESNENVLLSGFGKFVVTDKAARKGRNPKTSETMILAARKVVTFKPSGKLRDRANGK
jgi:integration host factor subunit alpha